MSSKAANNIGLLRIVFAACVIVGHAPELIDGNRGREPLTALGGALSLPEVAVDAFFLLSGFLLAQSAIRSTGFRDYMARRLARIYPGFLVAFAASVLVLGPLVGAHPLDRAGTALLRMIALLAPPDFPGQLAHLPYPNLNGCLWTIAFEARCYLLLGLLAALGVLARPRTMLALAILTLAAYGAAGVDALWPWVKAGRTNPLLGYTIQDPVNTLRLTGAFLLGASGYLYRDRLLPALDGKAALACACLAAAAVSNRSPFGEPTAILLGGLALMWLALKARLGPLRRINESYDISYGTYLYGWPIATGCLAFGITSNPIVLVLLTLPSALACGAASWWLIERPVLERVRRRHERRAMPAAAPAPAAAAAA